MSKKPLSVAILWHMHQPDYGNMQTGEIYLPWTRFHAAKDYYDMAALVAEEPAMRLTINVVPSLMDQLEAYGKGEARETYAELSLRDASDLDYREKSFLLRAFFQLPWHQMLLPFPRYRELKEKRGAPDANGEYSQGLRRFSAQDYRDLQVWFNLSWCGRKLRNHPDIAGLFEKGSGFSEDEKKSLIEIQFRFAGEVLPLYGRLMQEQGIELSVSPYYHPILPLLCENRTAREALPEIPLPANLFAFPADAREQIVRAQQRYKSLFGRKPAGMWPSEGSISEATVLLAEETGIRWVASDDGVLLNSLRKDGRQIEHLDPRHRLTAYQFRKGGTCLFFRDHGLSDLIGFTYCRWDSTAAAADFRNRLHAIHDALPDDGRNYVVPIILDGENAWEHYPDGGAPFLRSLYKGLTSSKRLQPVTFSEFLDKESTREPLGAITAGSWIYANLATWIGHPEKNRGWGFLSAARQFLATQAATGADPVAWQKAYGEILIAEGSDWFWWYGDDHHSENAAEFDALFRTHVKNVYRLLGHPYPMELEAPIKKARIPVAHRRPSHTMTPTIDGRATDYFEWLQAGFAASSGGTGSMHRVETYLERVYFGYDTRNFYLRIDLDPEYRQSFPDHAILRIQFAAPRECQIQISKHREKGWQCGWQNEPADLDPPIFAGDRVLELGLPLETLGIQLPAALRFFILVLENDREMERLPNNDFLEVSVDPVGLNHQEWIV
jgi:alpha-amylase/alpha-mannosidase (GH57 family)